MNPVAFERLTKSVPMNSVGWFDLLDRSGRLNRWLKSGEADRVRYATEVLTQPVIVKERGDAVAKFVRAGLDRAANPSPERNGYLSVFTFSNFLGSEALFTLFLERFTAGEFDEFRDLWWQQFQDLAEMAPARALRLLVAFLDRREAIAQQKGLKHLFEERDDAHSLPADLTPRLANIEPLGVVQHLLPRIVRLVKAYEADERENGLRLNTVWPILSQNVHLDFKYTMLDGVRLAMERLAVQNPEQLDALTDGLDQLPHRTIVHLLLSAWSANGAHYGNRIADYLLGHEARLDLGFDTWGEGLGIAAVSRAAVAAAFLGASAEKRARLEAAILTLHPPAEKKSPQRFGLLQFLLLSSLGEAGLSDEGKKRLQELGRKFKDVDISPPRPSGGAHWVTSPIPTEALPKMTDDQWLAAMSTYQSDRPDPRSYKDFMTGGAVEVSRQFGREVRHNKERFAKLALRMGPEVPAIYHDALITALVAVTDDSGNVPKSPPTKLPELATAELVPVFQHIHDLPGRPCGRWLCSAIGEIAQRELPNELLEMVAYYCTDDPDPSEVGLSERHDLGGDLVQYGINTTRGSAVMAISALLFAQPQRWSILENATLSALRDKSVIVQATAVSCLLPLLNIDRERATNLLLERVERQSELLGTMFVQDFVNRRAYADYGKLRGILRLMLKSDDREQRETAAGCITAASLQNPEAKADLDEMLAQNDEASRAAVASFAAHNFGPAEIRDTCRLWLIRFFNDDSKKVRDAAAQCFHRMSQDILAHESELLGAFIDSKSFQEHVSNLLHLLQGAVTRLPDIVLKIPEKAVALHEANNTENARQAWWWTNEMAALVLRLYDQTQEEEVRVRCLDVLDRLIELNFGNFSKELEKLDRS